MIVMVGSGPSFLELWACEVRRLGLGLGLGLNRLETGVKHTIGKSSPRATERDCYRRNRTFLSRVIGLQSLGARVRVRVKDG